jgi:hypothetical protein
MTRRGRHGRASRRGRWPTGSGRAFPQTSHFPVRGLLTQPGEDSGEARAEAMLALSVTIDADGAKILDLFPAI